jgi:hypothetical protein
MGVIYLFCFCFFLFLFLFFARVCSERLINFLLIFEKRIDGKDFPYGATFDVPLVPVGRRGMSVNF